MSNDRAPSTARWRKSSYSGGSGGDCVEIASNLDGIVPVRDTKTGDGSLLVFPADSWSTFVAGIVLDG